jgi:hypothetical protein
MSEPGHAARTGRLGHGDFARRAGLAFADALHLRGTEGIELEAALALLLLDRAARPGGRANASSSAVSPSILRRISRMIRPSRLRNCRLNCLARGIAARHHRRALGDPAGRLPQPHAVPGRQAVKPLDRRMQQLGIGREGDGLRLHLRSRRISHREEVTFLDFGVTARRRAVW